MLLSDTVGFIRDLPHHLIASFKATLEEARQARLLLHVVDASNPAAEEHIKAVNGVLKELGCGDKPTLLVLNKVDRLADPSYLHVLQRHHPRAVAAPRPRRWRRGALAAAVLICLFGGLGLTEATGVTKVAATVVRILTPDGTLVVQVDDPDVSVAIDGRDVVITGAGTKEIRLRPGRYTVLARKDGRVVRQELVTVEKDGREVVRLDREAAPASDAAPAGAGDPDRRAAEYVLSVGGAVGVNDMGGFLQAAADLPPGPFRLTAVSLRYKHVSDKGLASFRGCKNLTALDLMGTQVGDEGLANFKGCKNLRDVSLSYTRVTDAGLANFQGCKNLTSLGLNGTQVGDGGLANFKECKNLTSLIIRYGARVTDAGLANFKGCKNLTLLTLQKTKVTAAGIDALKKALPRCRIEWDGGVVVPP